MPRTYKKREKKEDPRIPVMHDMYMNKKMTLEEVGSHFDISRERVRQILSKHFDIGLRKTGERPPKRHSQKMIKQMEENHRIISVNCKRCDKPFEIKKHTYLMYIKMGKPRKYCSLKCRGNAPLDMSPEELKAHKKKLASEAAMRWRKKHKRYFNKLKNSKENKDYHRVRGKIHWLLQTGRLVRPELCETCGGDKGWGRIEAHLPKGETDTSKIVWNCTKCNAKERYKNRK